MTCGRCGAGLAEGSRFCNICGATMAASVVAVDPSAPERVVWTLRPAFLFVGMQYVVAGVLWLVAAAVIAAIVSYAGLSAGAGAVVVVVVGLLLFVKPILSHIRRQRQLFTLTNHKLEIQSGIIATTVRNIPLSKVQDVTVASSITQKLLGLGNIQIDNASEGGGRLTIANVRDAKKYTDILLGELRRWN
jgi:membrane protein YdbS with pleckstrin-like domain